MWRTAQLQRYVVMCDWPINTDAVFELDKIIVFSLYIDYQLDALIIIYS